MKHARCECGLLRNKLAKQCDRCADMDGRDVRTTELIQELRASDGPVSAYDMAGAVNRAVRSVIRSMRALERDGRVRRYCDGSPGSRDMALYTFRG